MKEDLRITKTKAALSAAFIDLLAEKKYDEVSVNELCDRADVRRATFYKHYADKFHFFACFTRDLANRFNADFFSKNVPDTAPEYYVEYVIEVIKFLEEHDRLVQNVIKSDLFPSMISIITEQNYRHTRERFRARVDVGRRLFASAEVTAAILNGGVANAIYMWLLEGRKKTPEELTGEIREMIRGSLKE